MLSETLLDEFGQILKEEFNKSFNSSDLESHANDLIKFFIVLEKIKKRSKKTGNLKKF